MKQTYLDGINKYINKTLFQHYDRLVDSVDLYLSAKARKKLNGKMSLKGAHNVSNQSPDKTRLTN